MRDRQQSILNGTHTESGKVEKTRGLKAILDSSTPTTSKLKAVSKVATKRKRTAGAAFASSDAHDLPMELAMLTPPSPPLSTQAATSFTTTAVSDTASNQGQKVPVGKRGRLTKAAPSTSSSSSTSQQHIADTETTGGATTTTSYSTSTSAAVTNEVTVGHTLDKGVLWAVGWDRFYQEERHRLCLTLVRERMGVIAGDVIKCMLETSLATEGKRNEPYSCRMSVDDIYYQMNKVPSTATATSSSTSSTAAAAGAAVMSVDRATLSSVLEIMRLDGVRILTKVWLYLQLTVSYVVHISII